MAVDWDEYLSGVLDEEDEPEHDDECECGKYEGQQSTCRCQVRRKVSFHDR